MKGLQGERLRQAFRFFDQKQTGYITPEDFKRIIFELARHKLSEVVLEALPTLCALTPGKKISYSECIAFHNVRLRFIHHILASDHSAHIVISQQVIREMDIVEKVVREACARSTDGLISASDFSSHASRSMRYGTFTPMEVGVIWHFAGMGTKTRLGLKDFAQLLDPKWGASQTKRVEPKGSFWHETGKVSCIFFRSALPRHHSMFEADDN